MLSRMKFETEILVSEILDQLSENVWLSNSTTFLDPAIGGGQFVRAIEQRLRSAGHSDANIKSRVFGFEESDLHIRFAVNKYKLVGQYVRKPHGQFFESDNTMDFDVEVGNPPYNKGMLKDVDIGNSVCRGYPHLYVMEQRLKNLKPGGTSMLIMPAGLMTLHSLAAYRKFILSNYNVKSIKIYNNTNKKYFDIDKFDNIIAITITKDQYSGQTTIIREGLDYTIGTSVVDLRKYSFWPMYFNQTSVDIFDKIKSKNNADGIKYLDQDSTSHYVSFTTMGDGNSYNHSKLWLLNQVSATAKNVCKAFFKDNNSAKLYYDFTQQQDLFNYVYSMCKGTPKNQPQFVAHIGNFDFVDSNYDDFFKFSDIEKEEYKKFKKPIK